MSKLSKLIRHPMDFFRDAMRNRRPLVSPPEGAGKVTFAFSFNGWKRDFYQAVFPSRYFFFIPSTVTARAFRRRWKPFIQQHPEAEIFVWGLNAPEDIKELPHKRYFIEDGFLRSVALGVERALPFSITMDARTPYFDARSASDLEKILMEHNFASDRPLMERATRLMERMLEASVSKYNHSAPADVEAIYGRKDRKRILVLGQVEDDASIKYGCENPSTNNDLVRLARRENPDAQILYKPHPDVLAKRRPQLSDPAQVRHLCQILSQDIPMAEAFRTIDHIYTLTSLAGFEGLMRSIKVTCVGCPFYAGWGLTDDRQPNSRRNRKLSVLEVFAAAYILYPLYLDPADKLAITPEQAMDRIIALRDDNRKRESNLVMNNVK